MMKHEWVIGSGMPERAAELFASGDVRIEPLGGMQNLVYAFERDGRPYVLRLTPEANRSECMVLAELDWIRYLADRGSPCPCRSARRTGGGPKSFRPPMGCSSARSSRRRLADRSGIRNACGMTGCTSGSAG